MAESPKKKSEKILAKAKGYLLGNRAGSPKKKSDKIGLMNCPKCKHRISKAARSCPDCGHPIGFFGKILESKLILLATSLLGITGLSLMDFLYPDNITNLKAHTREIEQPTQTQISGGSEEQGGQKFEMKKVPCAHCSGSGKVACEHCGGDGKAPCSDPRCKHGRIGYGREAEICTRCLGTGEMSCRECNGSGRKNCPRCFGRGETTEYQPK